LTSQFNELHRHSASPLGPYPRVSCSDTRYTVGGARELPSQGPGAVVSRWVKEGCPSGTRPEADAHPLSPRRGAKPRRPRDPVVSNARSRVTLPATGRPGSTATGGSHSDSSRPTSSWSTTRTTTEQEVRIMTMKNPVHPGEILREDVLADLGLSVGERLEARHLPRHVEPRPTRTCPDQPQPRRAAGGGRRGYRPSVAGNTVRARPRRRARRRHPEGAQTRPRSLTDSAAGL
jgi:hypothetical protein